MGKIKISDMNATDFGIFLLEEDATERLRNAAGGKGFRAFVETTDNPTWLHWVLGRATLWYLVSDSEYDEVLQPIWDRCMAEVTMTRVDYLEGAAAIERGKHENIEDVRHEHIKKYNKLFDECYERYAKAVREALDWEGGK